MALSLEAKLIAAALALLMLLGLFWKVFHDGEKHAQQAQAMTEAKNAAALVAQQKEDATISARRVQNLSEIAHDATVQADASRAAADRAARARDALRVQLNAYLAHARAADPPASAPGETGSDALDLLSNLFSESDDRSGTLAKALDRCYGAGLACEHSYDALKP